MEPKSVFLVSSEQTIGVTSTIAWMAALAGFKVKLKGEDEDTLSQVGERLKEETSIETNTDQLNEAEIEAAINRIETTANLSDAADAAVVIDSLFGNEDRKRDMLAGLDDICPSDTIFLTNASTIMVTHLASATSRADRVIGMHFVHYSPVMKVIEIARGLKTSHDTFSMARAFAIDLGFDPVVSEDAPGLLSSRIWMVHIKEAANNVFNGHVEAGNLMTLNGGISTYALSLLEPYDFIGLDNVVALLRDLYRAYGDPNYIPSPCLPEWLAQDNWALRAGRDSLIIN